jgi:hypothetical protein
MSKCFCRADMGYTCQPCTFNPPAQKPVQDPSDSKNVLPGLTLDQLNDLVNQADVFGIKPVRSTFDTKAFFDARPNLNPSLGMIQ